jgi:hypothetical protein
VSSHIDRLGNIVLQSGRLEALMEGLSQFGDVSCTIVESGAKAVGGTLLGFYYLYVYLLFIANLAGNNDERVSADDLYQLGIILFVHYFAFVYFISVSS